MAEVLHTVDLRQRLIGAFSWADEGSIDLLLSAIVPESPAFSMAEFDSWLDECNEAAVFRVERVPLSRLSGWALDSGKALRHESGKFFSVEGIHVHITGGSSDHTWDQPIINQPEMGILGILVQKRNGVLHFLLQGKIEPGNVNGVQLSPTVQATRSNYTQVHGGRLPAYLDWFLDPSRCTVLVDQLQTEQGARFLKKRNRNMILVVPDDEPVELLSNFCWLTLGQIKTLMERDNIVNMDTRTVLSCIQLAEGGDIGAA